VTEASEDDKEIGEKKIFMKNTVLQNWWQIWIFIAHSG
jgi:hypothetical protein